MEEQKISKKEEQPDVNRVLEVASKAGEILLENGAEISRVEETMARISAYFGVTDEEFFVLSNGIFTSGQDAKYSRSYARVKFIPMKGSQLYRVVMVNQVSRDVEAGKYTVDEVERKLDEIRHAAGKSNLSQILASGVGAGAFCLLFGGSFIDAAAAVVAGLLLYVFMIFVAFPHLSRIVQNLAGGALVTLICIVLYKLGFGQNMNYMIIGSIIPLIPGVAFTNGVRDIADADYISGIVRLMDAILGFMCIAIGVGVVFIIYRHLFGGGL